MAMREKQLAAFGRLLDIMDDLRAKCPWDKKQTMESLRHLTIEETYELGDAILNNDLQEVKKELGDLLLHIVFYIYGDVKVANEEDVKRNWEKIKLQEGNKSVLGGVPQSLPALVKASRIQDKAAGVGFDWENIDDVFAKIKEEIDELHAEVKAQKHTAIEAEFGDVLFSLINYARFLKVNPEDALERTNKKFITRFQYLERKAAERGKSLRDMTLAEMESYWQEAKGVFEPLKQ